MRAIRFDSGEFGEEWVTVEHIERVYSTPSSTLLGRWIVFVDLSSGKTLRVSETLRRQSEADAIVERICLLIYGERTVFMSSRILDERGER